MAYIPIALSVLGIVLIILGACLSIADWKSKRKIEIEKSAGQSETVGKPYGLKEEFEGLATLLNALQDYPLGAQLIVFGIVLELIAGVMGGAIALVH